MQGFLIYWTFGNKPKSDIVIRENQKILGNI
jgi:hypothetical protein